jgi:hypothetical protein
MSRLFDRKAMGVRKRDPEYKPILSLTPEERAALNERLDGAPFNAETLHLRLMEDPSKKEYLRAITSSILSAEFAGLDAFGRFLVEWQQLDIPWELTMSVSRQMWDETRHTALNLQLLESQGGELGVYPDTLASGAPPPGMEVPEPTADEPAMQLSTINVGLEGFALSLFERTRELAEKIGEPLMEHCHDYNMADEVLHVAHGDWWVAKLTEDDPDKERTARKGQQQFEEIFKVFQESGL